MNIIKLTKGFEALVDDQDFEPLSEWSWYALFNGRTHYAARGQRINGRLRCILMHRQISGVLPGQLCDHRNRNSLDNQRLNLRICDKVQNAANSKLRSDNTTGFKGVIFKSDYGTFRAAVNRINLGSFSNARDAALAYDKAAIERYGAFALTNKTLGLL